MSETEPFPTKQPRTTEYFMLDFNLVPQPCTQEEWLRWSSLEVQELAYTKIETEGVRTEFSGFRTWAGDKLFRTHSYGKICAGFTSSANTYEEAMRVHQAVCASSNLASRVSLLMAPSP